jgi:2-polyprenyl-3-methyl-5-hydroxy-6-metoxy-1,4-benzoquinol methylase
MLRFVKQELLDELPPADPRAVGSRGDLRRINGIMGHAGFFSRTFYKHLQKKSGDSQPLRICELGAGDGTLLLKIARCLSASGVAAQVTMVDRQNLVSEKTRREFSALDWPIENAAADVFDWLQQPFPLADVMLANLFLHHFQKNALQKLLRLASEKTNLFIACEPRRSPPALAAARLVGLIGCNAVTRHDAVASVRAGFSDGEISALWPANEGWQLRESRAGFFSHGFVAKRNV